MAKAKRVSIVVAMLVLGAGVPARASDPATIACRAEVSPRRVTSGATGESFTLKVGNGPGLPSPFSIAEIDFLRVQAPYYLQEWPPIEIVVPTSAAGPSPWTARIVGSPAWIVYEQGRIPLGDQEAFFTVADIANERGTFEWIIEASRDGGRTLQYCEPAFSGALDIIVS